MKMTFKEFLIEKNIKFKEVEDEGIIVSDELLYPHEKELRKILPKFEFEWEYLRYRNEPNGISG